MLKPRAVIVTRPTEWQAMLARHATPGQVEFFLQTRGQDARLLISRDQAQTRAVAEVKAALPPDWSLAEVARADLDRFLFFPQDIVIAVGQDGLVANLAKYLTSQPVIGLSPVETEGVLIRHRPRALANLLPRVLAGDVEIEPRSMIAAHLDGARLLALNDLFIGHRSHQSARYELAHGGRAEFQSSSGVVVTTGTGLSGWARSILAATGLTETFSATSPEAAFFAREPWPSRQTGTALRSGRIETGVPLAITSRIDEGGVIFADGVEQDFLRFDWGSRAEITLAPECLRLVV